MIPITHTSFKELTKTEQVGMVMRIGKELLTRTSDEFSVHLYILSNIFIEVWHETTENNIVKLNTINEKEIMQNYSKENDIIPYLFNK